MLTVVICCGTEASSTGSTAGKCLGDQTPTECLWLAAAPGGSENPHLVKKDADVRILIKTGEKEGCLVLGGVTAARLQLHYTVYHDTKGLPLFSS